MLPYKKISQSGIIPMAYHFNKIVVCSNLPSFTDHVIEKQTGYFFKNNNSNDLSAILSEIYQNHNFDQSKKYINEYKDRYSFDNFSKYFEELLK